MRDRGDGPLPDVLARLAEGVPAPEPRGRATRASRIAGVALCVITFGVVVASIIMAGAP